MSLNYQEFLDYLDAYIKPLQDEDNISGFDDQVYQCLCTAKEIREELIRNHEDFIKSQEK